MRAFAVVRAVGSLSVFPDGVPIVMGMVKRRGHF
jgi:hypothetical protein